MEAKIKPLPYKIECKDIEIVLERYKHLGDIKYAEIDGSFNALMLKENQFFALCNGAKYYLITVKT